MNAHQEWLRRHLAPGVIAFTVAAALPAKVAAQRHRVQDAPIRYSTAVSHDPLALLFAQADGGEGDALDLPRDPAQGYLPGLLKALHIPASSQGLVFSKTSFQNQRITPSNPRAIYFGDDVYVGFVPGGHVLEVTAVDPELGPVFYTIDQTAPRALAVRRHGECLSCHNTGRTGGWPGHLVRSVFTDHDGHTRTDARTFVTTQNSPFARRWGGWYVTGQHGELRHMGNQILGTKAAAASFDRDKGANVLDVSARVPTSRYPTPHSDIVALMVLEHQTHMHNVLARAHYTVRRAHHFAKDDEAVGEAALERALSKSTESVVEALLFKNEARFPSPIVGTSTFARDFAARGPQDEAGRSLRQFDLNERLFAFPCSYLIYSAAFDGLPDDLRERIYARLARVLSGRTSRRAWGLSVEQREGIRDILVATKPAAGPALGELEIR